ncbi:hypothetical protein BKA82DRAFT_4099873 [Pisolithus tinctorius]|nr:hypothetical protein BKA82DRAFT_4099873 [Pisolithus tinctorius]
MFSSRVDHHSIPPLQQVATQSTRNFILTQSPSSYVEDSLFRISREPLEAESAVFRDMFLLPQGESETVEGQSDTCAVILQGISKKEFESLLRALMYRSVCALT